VKILIEVAKLSGILPGMIAIINAGSKKSRNQRVEEECGLSTTTTR
jgi:hypothetical protein